MRRVAAALFVTGFGDWRVHIWNATSRAEEQVIPQTAGEAVTSLSFSPDGRRLAPAGFNGKVKIWDTESGLDLSSLAGHTNWVFTVSFSPDGQRIVSGSHGRTLRIWDGSPLPREATNSP
jgi:WD40 repeat protein